MSDTIAKCSCGSYRCRVEIEQFAACPTEYSVVCNWTTGGCGKRGEWSYSREQAVSNWNELMKGVG